MDWSYITGEMVKLQLYQTIFIILIFVGIVQCRIGLKLANLKCTSLNEETVQFEKCALKAVKRDIVEISVYGKLLLKPISNISFQLSFNRRGDNKSKSLYQYKVDACEFMSKTRRNPLAEIFFKVFEMQKYSNINHSCPYDHDLILHRGRLDTKPLNFLAISQGEYTLYTTWYAYAKPSAEIDISVIIS